MSSAVSVGLQVLVSGLPWVTWIPTHPHCKPIWKLDPRLTERDTEVAYSIVFLETFEIIAGAIVGRVQI